LRFLNLLVEIEERLAWFNEWIWATDQIRRNTVARVRKPGRKIEVSPLLMVGKASIFASRATVLVLGEPGASATGGYTTQITSTHDSSTVT
jgi:hypothetical protein